MGLPPPHYWAGGRRVSDRNFADSCRSHRWWRRIGDSWRVVSAGLAGTLSTLQSLPRSPGVRQEAGPSCVHLAWALFMRRKDLTQRKPGLMSIVRFASRAELSAGIPGSD